MLTNAFKTYLKALMRVQNWIFENGYSDKFFISFNFIYWFLQLFQIYNFNRKYNKKSEYYIIQCSK